jgi:hypothetical protein
MNQVMRMLGNQFSGGYSARGFNSPENTNAVMGSALTAALPNLFALQNQNQLLPSQINAGNIMTMTAPLAPLQQLGSVGSKSLGAGLDYQNTAAANSNYWSMLNNIGSFWGGGGGGKAAGVV